MTCEESIKWIDSLIKTLGQSQYQSLWNWEQPLTEIKEMLENKRVIELPCKVGDTVYRLDIDTGYIDPLTVENMVIDEEEIILRADSYDYVICHSSNITEKTPYNDCFLVFLTKSEAEQKLKELKENA